MPAAAKTSLSPDGTLTVSSGTSDIGTGTYTMMAILAGEALGLPLDRIVIKLGDSELPVAPLEGGSWTVASVGTAVAEACQAVAENVFKLAPGIEGSPLKHASFKEVEFTNERIALRSDASLFVTLQDALAAGDSKTH
jgi:xanthine dehydrogenase YagR molybdenum-binding subunit